MSPFEAVHEAFAAYCDADPDLQRPAHACTSAPSGSSICPAGRDAAGLAGPRVLEQQGRHRGGVALLVERGAARPRRDRASYWPEFAQAGKGAVTVRQLLSHQAGLPGVDGGFTWEELLDHPPLAERLAAQRPFWRPGAGAPCTTR